MVSDVATAARARPPEVSRHVPDALRSAACAARAAKRKPCRLLTQRGRRRTIIAGAGSRSYGPALNRPQTGPEPAGSGHTGGSNNSVCALQSGLVIRIKLCRWARQRFPFRRLGGVSGWDGDSHWLLVIFPAPHQQSFLLMGLARGEEVAAAVRAPLVGRTAPALPPPPHEPVAGLRPGAAPPISSAPIKRQRQHQHYRSH